MAVGKRWSCREVVGTQSQEHKERPQVPGAETRAGLGVRVLCGQEADVYKSEEKKGHVEKEQIFFFIALKRWRRDELVMLGILISCGIYFASMMIKHDKTMPHFSTFHNSIIKNA